MGGQSPAEFVRHSRAAGADTMSGAVADIQSGCEHWPAVLADAEAGGYSTDNLTASLERTLLYDGGMTSGNYRYRP